LEAIKNLCIIPARGGSKRIPRKNIKDFLGKPIIAYSIEAALESKLFDEVMVSTDDSEIKEIAIQYGAKVPFMRSKENANDFATTYDVIEEVIQEYKNKNIIFDNLCCIYPCAPFVNLAILNDAYIKLTESKYDTVIPLVAFGFPIQRSFKINNNKIVYFYPEYEKTRSQDLEKAYHDAGQFYWMHIDNMLKSKSIMNKNTGFVELNELQVQDIDNEMDWKLAELKYRLINK